MHMPQALGSSLDYAVKKADNANTANEPLSGAVAACTAKTPSGAVAACCDISALQRMRGKDSEVPELSWWRVLPVSGLFSMGEGH